MSRNSQLPFVLALFAAAATAVLAVFLFIGAAQAPSAAPAQGESQTQAAAREEANVLTKADLGAPAAAPTLAEGFQDRKVADALGATALAFLPDGRLLVTDRDGRVRLRQPGTTGTTVALDISGKVCSNSERGLLGVAVDPAFGTAGNDFVYLYYTHKKFGTCPSKEPDQNNPVNRVARYVMNGDGTIDGGSEDVLIDNIPSPNGNHNAGDVHFGKDGKLYVSVGDGSCNFAAPTRCQPENDVSRYRNVLNGKILRVNPDGTIPPDNPYPDGVRCGLLDNRNAAGGSAAAPGSVCAETYATGFRNPFRFAMDPDAADVSLRANDVGGARIEEVSQVVSGGDYGWNCREGTAVLNTQAPCPGDAMQPPISQYNHSTGCSSITGGAFVPNNAGWPTSYRDVYLYGDYVCNKIFKLSKVDGRYVRTNFAVNLADGGPVSFAFGPDGALYYTTYAEGGQVRRIAYVDNKSPVADLKATPTDPETGNTFGPNPLTVAFDASGSTDPEGQNLTYAWDFGDPGSATNTGSATDTAGGPNATHTYDTAGAYTATLTVKDDKGNADTAQKTVYAGNTAPPQPVIESPSSGKTFRVGERVSLSGSATDADGQDVTLKWTVIRHHTAPNGHEHRYEEFTGANAAFTAPGPEDLASTNPAGNYVEVRLTATDSQGLSKTVSRDLKPRTTNVLFRTRPYGFFVYVNGAKVRAPRMFLSWEGANLNVYAPPQVHNGKRYVFRAWSDGRGARHTIVVPTEYRRYTAAFRAR